MDIEQKNESRHEELLRLQSAQQELQKHVAVIEKSEQRLAALNAISTIITQSLEIQDVLTLASVKITEVMDADAIMVFLMEESTSELVLELYTGVSHEFVDGVRRIKIGEGFNGTVAQTGKPLIIENADTNPLLHKQVVITEGIKSQLIVPLKTKGKVIGTLCVAKRTSANFYPDEVDLLTSIGNQIGAGLENARLYQEMKQTLAQLQQSEERFRDLFENASDALWSHDFDGKTIAANQACEKVTGYSTEELMEMKIDQLMEECSKSCVYDIEVRLLKNERIDHRCEVELAKKDGTKGIIEVTTSIMTHEGKAIGFQHAARDVTEERRMQKNLRYYLQQVTRAQEEERKRIARELHDETLQNLIVISRQMDKITSSEALWEESLEVVRGLKKQIESAVWEMRRFSHDLRPSVLDDLGLLPALELLADDLEKQGMTTTFKVIGEASRLSPEIEVMLFRIAQEAVRNIWRHAKASEANLTIEFTNTKLRVSINDNGKGFSIPSRLGDQASLGKLGLVGMQERASLLGGALTINSKPGEGTTIIAEVRV